jgi:mannose-6-phosphate isomerase-like protein (cupin superfamily)
MEREWSRRFADMSGALGGGILFKEFFADRGLSIELYRPDGVDRQTPHDRDEVYLVVSGSGLFERAGERIAFGPGDLIFVPKGVEHRFEEFSEDFVTWVIFY